MPSSIRAIEKQPPTPTTVELLDAMRQELGGVSDYRVAIELGVTRATVSSWRQGKTKIGDEFTDKVAEILNLPPGYVLCAVNAERAKHSHVAERFRGLARVVLIGEKLIRRVKRAAPAIAAAAVGLAASTSTPTTSHATSLNVENIHYA
jgi:transcriptional regulator with XRE-family HTH domain